MVYPLARYTLFPVIKFFIKKTVGLGYLPPAGPFIIACKHLGPLDGVFIGAMVVTHLNRKMSYIANVAKWGWFWETIVAQRWGSCIPFDREHPQECLDIAVRQLREGRIVGIFPEGILQDYVAAGGRYRAKTGVARLGITSRVPIVPVGLVHDISVREDLPRLRRRRQVIKNLLLNPHSLEIHIGEPFTLDQYYDREITKELLIDATNDVMDRIDRLTQVRVR